MYNIRWRAANNSGPILRPEFTTDKHGFIAGFKIYLMKTETVNGRPLARFTLTSHERLTERVLIAPNVLFNFIEKKKSIERLKIQCNQE